MRNTWGKLNIANLKTYHLVLGELLEEVAKTPFLFRLGVSNKSNKTINFQGTYKRFSMKL